MKRAAIYARVSTGGQTTALQLDECERFCHARGWALVTTLEDQVSGMRERRPGLDELLSLARRRRIDVIVVWKRDRLFRSLRHLVNTSEELADLGVDFVSVTEEIDTTTSQGRLMLRMLASLAEFERDLLIERTKAGMAAAARRGAKIGRPKVVVDLDQVRELRREGHSIREVAQRMKIGYGTLHRALSAAAPAALSSRVDLAA